MSPEYLPKHDPRTVDELFNAALIATDEDIYWNAVMALHFRGSAEVLQRAGELCRSECAMEREVSADVLGQLGVPERTFPRECCQLLRSLLQHKESSEVLKSAMIALSHQDDTEAVSLVREFMTYANPEVRHAVVLALTGHLTPLAIESLIILSADSDSDVRDWATFGLGTQIDLTTPELCDALAARLDDLDDDTRAEAFIGLARREDNRVIGPLKKELRSNNVGTLVVEAAELIASSDLYSELIELQKWWDVDSDLLARAIVASRQN